MANSRSIKNKMAARAAAAAAVAPKRAKGKGKEKAATTAPEDSEGESEDEESEGVDRPLVVGTGAREKRKRAAAASKKKGKQAVVAPAPAPAEESSSEEEASTATSLEGITLPAPVASLVRPPVNKDVYYFINQDDWDRQLLKFCNNYGLKNKTFVKAANLALNKLRKHHDAHVIHTDDTIGRPALQVCKACTDNDVTCRIFQEGKGESKACACCRLKNKGGCSASTPPSASVAPLASASASFDEEALLARVMAVVQDQIDAASENNAIMELKQATKDLKAKNKEILVLKQKVARLEDRLDEYDEYYATTAPVAAVDGDEDSEDEDDEDEDES